MGICSRCSSHCCHLFTLMDRRWPHHRGEAGLRVSDGKLVNHTTEMIMWSMILTRLQGIARTQTPTNKNYALELLTFGTIAGVSPPVVQWTSLTLGEPPSWSWLTPVPGKYAQPTAQLVHHSLAQRRFFGSTDKQNRWAGRCVWMAALNR